MFHGKGYQHGKCEQYFMLEEENKCKDEVPGIKSRGQKNKSWWQGRDKICEWTKKNSRTATKEKQL